MMRHPALLLILLPPLASLSGCGQKGNLYMEGHEPRSQMGAVKAQQRRDALEAKKQAEETLKSPSKVPEAVSKPKAAAPAQSPPPSNGQPKPYEEGSTPNPAKRWVSPDQKTPDLEPSAPN